MHLVEQRVGASHGPSSSTSSTQALPPVESLELKQIEPAFVSVLEDVEMTPDRELNVTAYDNVAAQDRIASLSTHAA